MKVVIPGGRRYIVNLPPSHERLSALAVRALREVEAYGVLPTPVDALYEKGGLSLISEQTFADRTRGLLKSLPPALMRKALLTANKVKGATNLRTKRVWVPGQRNPAFERHPKLHEWGHNVIPWQDKPGFLDDRSTLSPETHDLFEREANFIAAEANFQAGLFRERALALKTSIQSALALADEHGATYSSTLWRYVEVMDTPVALLVYSKGRAHQFGATPRWLLRRINMSNAFGAAYESLEAPKALGPGAYFLRTLDDDVTIADGRCKMRCEGSTPAFLWESWSNTSSVFVMVRRAPLTSRVGGVLRAIRSKEVAVEPQLIV